MRYRIPGLTVNYVLDRQGKQVWLIAPHASGFRRNNLHICQNLIFRPSLIHKVGFCLENVFFFINVWLPLSTCNCGLTSLLNVRGCFSFISKWRQKNYALSRDRRKNCEKVANFWLLQMKNGSERSSFL